MDWYLVVKFVHIVAAIFWLGGGFAMLIAGTLAGRDADRTAVLRYMAMVNSLGFVLFMPASLTVLASGLVMAAVWMGFSDAWLVLSLAGIAASIGMGVGFIKPVGERITTRAAKDGMSPAVMADVERLTRIGRVDFAVMLTIVALMVFKPGWQDTAVLFTLGLLLAFAVAVLLIPRRPRAAVAAA